MREEGDTAASRLIRSPHRLATVAVLSFLPRSMPMLSRANYQRELHASFFFPFALACVEGGVIGVIVRSAYDGVVPDPLLNTVVAALMAMPALANIVSFIWVRLAHGLDKVRFVNALQLAMVLCTAGIAFSPRTPGGLAWLCVMVLVARLCYAGVVTLRSTVWGNNYPRHARGRVTGKITTIQVTIVALAGMGIGAAMEQDERAYRLAFPVLAAIALVGVWFYAQIRLRGRQALRSAEIGTQQRDRPSINPATLRRTYLEDKAFDRFMACQMVLGLGNIMMWPLVVLVLKEQFEIEYLGVLLTHTIPMLMMPLTIPLWARFLDRVHIVRFRSVHSWMFVIAAVFMLGATLFHSLWMLYAAAATRGIAYSGGALAWNLGHHDFAPKGRESEYMAVHVTLTGVRGLTAPFLGVMIYEILLAISPDAGGWVFLLCGLLSAIGAIGFWRMDVAMRREKAARDARLVQASQRAEQAEALQHTAERDDEPMESPTPPHGR